jgi:hypothetical protein
MWIGGSSKIARTAEAVVCPESPVWFRLRRLRWRAPFVPDYLFLGIERSSLGFQRRQGQRQPATSFWIDIFRPASPYGSLWRSCRGRQSPVTDRRKDMLRDPGADTTRISSTGRSPEIRGERVIVDHPAPLGAASPQQRGVACLLRRCPAVTARDVEVGLQARWMSSGPSARGTVQSE